MLYQVARCYVDAIANSLANENQKKEYCDLLSWLDEHNFKYSVEISFDFDFVLHVYRETNDIYKKWSYSNKQNMVKDCWHSISDMKEYLLSIIEHNE